MTDRIPERTPELSEFARRQFTARIAVCEHGASLQALSLDPAVSVDHPEAKHWVQQAAHLAVAKVRRIVETGRAEHERNGA